MSFCKAFKGSTKTLLKKKVPDDLTTVDPKSFGENIAYTSIGESTLIGYRNLWLMFCNEQGITKGIVPTAESFENFFLARKGRGDRPSSLVSYYHAISKACNTLYGFELNRWPQLRALAKGPDEQVDPRSVDPLLWSDNAKKPKSDADMERLQKHQATWVEFCSDQGIEKGVVPSADNFVAFFRAKKADLIAAGKSHLKAIYYESPLKAAPCRSEQSHTGQPLVEHSYSAFSPETVLSQTKKSKKSSQVVTLDSLMKNCFDELNWMCKFLYEFSLYSLGRELVDAAGVKRSKFDWHLPTVWNPDGSEPTFLKSSSSSSAPSTFSPAAATPSSSKAASSPAEATPSSSKAASIVCWPSKESLDQDSNEAASEPNSDKEPSDSEQPSNSYPASPAVSNSSQPSISSSAVSSLPKAANPVPKNSTSSLSKTTPKSASETKTAKKNVAAAASNTQLSTDLISQTLSFVKPSVSEANDDNIEEEATRPRKRGRPAGAAAAGSKKATTFGPPSKKKHVDKKAKLAEMENRLNGKPFNMNDLAKFFALANKKNLNTLVKGAVTAAAILSRARMEELADMTYQCVTRTQDGYVIV